MIHPPIQYRIVSDAIDFFSRRGFYYTEAPWVVSEDAYNVTVPVGGEQAEDFRLVASGEQSFMQMRLDKKLQDGSFVCATPCYRPWDKSRSVVHYSQFFKVEAITLTGDRKPSEREYDHLINTAFAFMARYRSDLQVVETTDDPRVECETLISHDIESADHIEMGSYGIRRHDKIGHWIYGTVVAVPRFEQQSLKI